MGHGLIYSKSSKQKLNTKSSTESEVFGASDYLPQLSWTQNFMAAQGFKFKRNIFYHDIQPAMRLERNGRQLCGQKSRHIDIRYFYQRPHQIRQHRLTILSHGDNVSRFLYQTFAR